MSYGMAPSRSATCRTWLLGTNKNVGSLSMKRLINQGHAMRSTRAFSRVIHFMTWGASLLAAVRLVERGFQCLCQLRRVVVGPEVHVEQPRRIHERMIVDRGHVDAVLSQRLGHGIHFLVGQHEITRDGRLAV